MFEYRKASREISAGFFISKLLLMPLFKDIPLKTNLPKYTFFPEKQLA